MTKPFEKMTPFERIEHDLALIEWGDRNRDPLGMCPSCGRMDPQVSGRDTTHTNGHAYGCAVRTIRDQLEQIPEIYF